MLSDLYIRFRSLFRRRVVEEELDDELRFHLEQQAAKYIRAGLSPEQAKRRARLEFGGLDQIRGDCREARGITLIWTVVQDVRFGVRMLRKSPEFTLAALLTLAVGIGANAVVFGLLNALILRPVNVPDPQKLVMIERGQFPSNSIPDYVDLRDRNHTFDGLVAYSISPAGLNSTGTPEPVWIYEASGNYFDVLGVQPELGRFFHGSDEHGANSAPFIVLSHGYWQSHFQGDRSIVGRVVRLNNLAFTILGVAPPEFRGTERFFAPDLWVPLVDQQQIDGSSDLDSRGARGTWVVGRLKAGVSPAQGSADLNSIASWLAKNYPADDEGLTISLARPGLLGDMLGSPVHAFLAGLTILAGLILLATCANLGSLFAARASDRSREVAVRLSLGSTRRRILRQLLTEAMLVSLGGSALGLAVSIPLLRALSAWQPVPNIPINLPINPDGRTYLLALGLALLSGLLFGLVPVRQVMKTDPYQGIKSNAVGAATGRRATPRDILLVAQIAVCAVLITSSLVAVRGMVRSLHINFGFVPQNAMQVYTDVGMGGYRGDQVRALQRSILDAVSAVPGVKAVGYADRVPLNLGWNDSSVFADTTTDYKPSNVVTYANQYSVSPGYFEAAGTSLLQGRSFTWKDDRSTPLVAVVNREFARLVFGSESHAVGGHFKVWGGQRVEVAGIVENGKYKTLSEGSQAAMFFPILQRPSSDTWLIVRSNRDVRELTASLEQALSNLNTGLPFVINTWNKELDTALFAARAASLALGVLGGLGAMLAVTGIFGMAAYSVSKRLRELGIRIALGAGRREVLAAALGRAFRLLAFGSAAGLLLGVAAGKVLAFIVYQATPRDPSVLVGVVGFMLLVGLVATWIPARRALAVDPLVLLRDE